jgi:hypothetical protein
MEDGETSNRPTAMTASPRPDPYNTYPSFGGGVLAARVIGSLRVPQPVVGPGTGEA